MQPNEQLCMVQATTDMEEVFLNLGLDIIGLGVFNYDFKSITKESPVIKVRPLLQGNCEPSVLASHPGQGHS